MDASQPLLPAVTPAAFRCPACAVIAPMVISHPWWNCAYCQARLIPADLYPRLPNDSDPAIPDQQRHRRVDPPHVIGEPLTELHNSETAEA